ncbi:hypothetical protein [Paludisphaera mucosa]|uniref:Lipocalin-like domain-containing protein n=1 Tax=Paludisphaera mucosa TaxID=3030827 RepID=A0ABT6FKE5_9BACT|nr:hypothetical protein [Paludisphaera mucosa]MDG3008004.1 hypothetical protein [Paludisphaera mucosa]
MRKSSAVAALVLIGCLSIALLEAVRAQDANPAPDPAGLVGTWVVDLRPKPADQPYLKEFVVAAVADGGLAGTFYDSEVEDGRTNADWGAVHFAFTTTDPGGGTYNTSGKLVGDALEGTTHSLGRKFLRVWKAARKPKSS